MTPRPCAVWSPETRRKQSPWTRRTSDPRRHWSKRRPSQSQCGFRSTDMPENLRIDHAGYHATITTVTFEEKDQLLIIINILERRMGFFLSGYPAIREFMTILKKRD